MKEGVRALFAGIGGRLLHRPGLRHLLPDLRPALNMPTWRCDAPFELIGPGVASVVPATWVPSGLVGHPGRIAAAATPWCGGSMPPTRHRRTAAVIILCEYLLCRPGCVPVHASLSTGASKRVNYSTLLARLALAARLLLGHLGHDGFFWTRPASAYTLKKESMRRCVRAPWAFTNGLSAPSTRPR